MLTALKRSDKEKVGAWEVEKNEGPFECHCCRSLLTLRRGGIKAPHFAHQPPVTCEYGTGESEEHRRCKLEIYENLVAHPQVTKCEMERSLGAVRPDVSAYLNGVPVAIEVQISTLSLDKIQYRTEQYARRGIYLIWLPLYTPSLGKNLYQPRPWERWLHAAYFGRAYYWVKALSVLPIHFRDYYTRVRGRTRDYQKRSRMKVPIPGQLVNLAEDFRPICRDEFRANDSLAIPKSRLFVDAQPRWYNVPSFN
ncbi:MAG: competence protein CoiA family protein [Pyrinomonadaceae bacterium]